MSSSVLISLSLAVIILSVAVDSQNPACCNFLENNCNWSPSTEDANNNYNWKWSNDSTPDLTNVNDFSSSARPSYLWLQDLDLTESTNATVTSVTFAINLNDYLTIDVYRHVVHADEGPQPILYFDNEDGSTSLELDLSSDQGWTTNTFQCGDYLPCCIDYPCYGYLKVVGILYDEGDLLAFDNIGVNAACSVPENPSCCRFEKGEICNLEPVDRWYSSASKEPWWPLTKGIMTHPTDYMWTQNGNGDPLPTTLIVGVTSTSSFNFQYYGDVTADSPKLRPAYLSVRFETETASHELARLGDTMEWIYYSIDCSVAFCCGTESICNGNLNFLTIFSNKDEAFYAIDDLEIAGGCGNPKCCAFSTSDFCGWNDRNTVTSPWKWSGINMPNPEYISGNFTQTSGHYVWLQLTETAADPDSVLVSPDVTKVDGTFFFTVSYYVEVDPSDSTNSLNVYFQEDNVVNKVLLAALNGTDGAWQSGVFRCSEVADTQSCCEGGSTCNGHLELDASEADGIVFYAIDNLEINGQCVGREIYM